MTTIPNPCGCGYPSPYAPAPHVGALPSIDVDKTLQAAVDKVAPAVEKYAADALKGIGQGLAWVWNKIECTIDPAKCRHRERREKYRQLTSSLLKEAKSAASSGDFVSAYAFAEAASTIDSKPPFLDYFHRMPGHGDLVRLQVKTKADALAMSYRKKAEVQAQAGKGGTFKPGALPDWLPYVAGAAALFFLVGRRK